MSALPPNDLAWQIGKTAASIKFVNDMEAWIAAHPNEKEEFVWELRQHIKGVKEGKFVFNDFVDVFKFWTK